MFEKIQKNYRPQRVKILTIALFAFKAWLQNFMFCFKRFFTLELSESPISNFILFSLIFCFSYWYLKLQFSYKQPLDSSNSTNCPKLTLPLLNKKLYLSVMSLSLCSLVRSTFFSVVTRFSTSERKPWLYLLFLVFLLDLSLEIVELALDTGLVIILEATKSLGTKILFCHVCWFAEKKKQNYFLL